MFAESIKEVLFPIEKQNLYVRNNLDNTKIKLLPLDATAEIPITDGWIPLSSLSYVGECLVNMDDHTVYKIGKDLKYTPTQDLIEQVRTEYGNFTPHIIHYSKDKSSVYINVIISQLTALALDYRYALEISNNYSGRFSPRLTLSLYNIEKDRMIRTPIPAFNINGSGNISGINIMRNIVTLRSVVSVDYDVIRLLPKKFKDYDIKGNMTLLTALDRIAEIVDKWIITNYELATETQKKIYTILTNKGIEE